MPNIPMRIFLSRMFILNLDSNPTMVNETNGLNGIQAWYIALNVPKEFYKSDLRDMLKIEGIKTNINLGLSGRTLADHITNAVEEYIDDMDTVMNIDDYDTVMKGYLALNILYADNFRSQNRDDRGNKTIPVELLPYVKEKVELLESYNRNFRKIQSIIK